MLFLEFESFAFCEFVCERFRRRRRLFRTDVRGSRAAKTASVFVVFVVVLNVDGIEFRFARFLGSVDVRRRRLMVLLSFHGRSRRRR